jgi:hypothetical protein
VALNRTRSEATTNLTVALPDQLARSREEIAAAQQKTVAHQAVEQLRSLVERGGDLRVAALESRPWMTLLSHPINFVFSVISGFRRDFRLPESAITVSGNCAHLTAATAGPLSPSPLVIGTAGPEIFEI